MKIALVVGSYYPFIGGVETHVQEIANRLVKKASSLQVEVLTTDPSRRLPKNESVNGIEVRRFDSFAPHGSYYFSRSIRRYLLEHSNDFDVVHAHGYHGFPPLYAAQAKGRNKLVFTPHYHGTGHTFFRALLHQPYKFFGKRIFEKADKVICVSLYERGLVLKNFGIEDDKVEVIPNGVDLEGFKNIAKRKGNYPTVLSVGRLEKYKGIQYLISVLPKLDVHVKLEIVGKGPYKKDLMKLSRKLNVAYRVNFYQDLPRNELLQKYADADVFCLLSEREAYGICVAEALCAKTPCIVANTSALTEWIDSKNCFGIDLPIHLDELASVVNNVVGKNIEELRIPDWNEVTDRLAALYEDIVD